MQRSACLPVRQGFTLLETLLVVGTVGLISSFSIPLYRAYQLRNDLAVAKNQVVQGLERAKRNAMSGVEDASWSFYIPEGVLFAGDDYAAYDPNQAEVYPMPSSIRTSGLTQVTYNPFGKPNMTGEILLTAISGDEDSVLVTIEIETQRISTTVGDTVTICHKPGQNQSTLHVPDNAWPAHQAHGDTIGACPGTSSSSAVSSVASSSSSTSCVSSTGLVGHWKLDETSGTVASDASGSANHGTVLNSTTGWSSNVATAISPNPRSFDFDGSNDAIRIGKPASINNIDVKTVTAWIYPSSYGEGGYGRIVDKLDSTAYNLGWFFHASTNNGQDVARLKYYHSFNGNAGSWATPANSLPLNQWVHVALVYDRRSSSNQPQMYINGVSQTVTQEAAPSGTVSSDADSNMYIGNRPAYDRTFDGNIDDVRLYARALSSAEVQQIAQGATACAQSSSSSSSSSSSGGGGGCPFTMDASQVITTTTTTSVTFTNMLSRITFGLGGPSIPVSVCYSDNGGSSYRHATGSSGTCSNGNGNGHIVQPGGTDTKTVSIASGRNVLVRVNGRYRQNGWLAFDETFRSNDTTGHVVYYTNGETLGTYPAYGSQQSLRDYLIAQGKLNAQGQVTIGACEVLAVTELGQLNTASADFQDDVLLMSFQ